jgi:integrase
MLNEPMMEKLAAMRLTGMADAIKAQQQDPTASELSFHERLGILVDQQWNWRENQNPATALFTPRHYQEGRSREVLTPEQAAILIGALELREKVIVRMATWEGMRPGEILALQLGDLDDDSVWVRRRVYKGDIDEPKTKRSTRRVALTVGTLALLDQWKLRLLGSLPETWIFGSEKGTPMRRDNIWRKSMYPKLKPVGLEWATFQVMRRTFATLSKAAGGMLIPGRHRWATQLT